MGPGTKAVTAQQLNDLLRTKHIVVLPDTEWTALADGFDEVERHDTKVAGDLQIIQTGSGLAAVEQPSAAERVVRVLGGVDEVRQFVRERLSIYERMWDGCGCKVDYYG